MISTKNLDEYYVEDIFDAAYIDERLNNKLAGANICLWFQQPSTRTYLSFSRAAQELGAFVTTLSDSAMAKGESFVETIKTMETMGYDILVLRNVVKYSAEMAQENTSMKIVNAGDGTNEHPTQALGDLYTIIDTFGDVLFDTYLKDLKIVFVGDTLHSRVVRSLMPLLDLYGATIGFLEKEAAYGGYKTLENMDEVSDWKPDVIYMLRDQLRQLEVSDTEKFQLKERHLYSNGPKIMHPGPVNIGREIAHNHMIGHKNSLIRKQVINGVKVRKAILAREILGDLSDS